MSYTNAFQPTSRKIQETEKLISLIEGKTGPYILTGDFNAQPNSEVINKISNVMANAGPDFIQKTWTTKPFSYDGFKATTLDWRLDYIFTNPNLQNISAEILKTDLSDHLPILASFDIK